MEYLTEIAVIYNLTSKLSDLHDTSLLHGIAECNPTILVTRDGSIGPRILKASCRVQGGT